MTMYINAIVSGYLSEDNPPVYVQGDDETYSSISGWFYCGNEQPPAYFTVSGKAADMLNDKFHSSDKTFTGIGSMKVKSTNKVFEGQEFTFNGGTVYEFMEFTLDTVYDQCLCYFTEDGNVYYANTCDFTGTFGKDVTVSESGKAVYGSVAAMVKYDPNAEEEEDKRETSWVNVCFFNKTAEKAATLKKGNVIHIRKGKFQYKESTKKETGATSWNVEVVVNSFIRQKENYSRPKKQVPDSPTLSLPKAPKVPVAK